MATTTKPRSSYLLPEDQGSYPKLTMSQRISINTGIGFASGAIVAGLGGLIQGISTSPSEFPVKLKLNAGLNRMEVNGTKYGNKMGILALEYSVIWHGISYVVPEAELHSVSVHAITGAVAGAVYNSRGGLKSIATGAAIGACAGATLALSRPWLVDKLAPIFPRIVGNPDA